MPRADEPRVTVRFSKVDFAMLEAAAVAGDVAVGALVREGALKFARELAGEASSGRGRMRRRSPARASSEVEKSDAFLAGGFRDARGGDRPPAIEDAEFVGDEPTPGFLSRVTAENAAPRPVEIPKDGAERTAFFQRLSQRP